ncbi:MAG: DNA-3-methyladenine glycosylase [Acidimicrobiia bacterium]|nr:DNA-3-methyladenine glycosylase [Acidimicrobiia bacterium]
MDTALRTLLGRPAVEVAPLLLGMTFRTSTNGVVTSVRLTEVEAYMGTDDPASHAYRGITPRTRPMFGAAGVIYVYLSYGVHHCVNIVTGREGEGQAVLLRAGTPVEGVTIMEERRGRSAGLTDGPGKLGQALGLTTAYSGAPIDGRTIELEPGEPTGEVLATPRVGISRATERPWRFVTG